MSKLLDVSKMTIVRNLNILKENNYIERIGSDKKGIWKIK